VFRATQTTRVVHEQNAKRPPEGRIRYSAR
jgi:hypothetical protein